MENLIQEELTNLKQMADTLGINYGKNIGIEALKQKIQEKRNSLEKAYIRKDINEIRKKAKKEALKLIRCRITNLNPDKRVLHGEVWTIANTYIGKVSKYVPYDEAGQAYHLPKCLFDFLKTVQYTEVREVLSGNSKNKKVYKMKKSPEFSLEILPQLTPQELKDLAIEQDKKGSIDDSTD